MEVTETETDVVYVFDPEVIRAAVPNARARARLAVRAGTSADALRSWESGHRYPTANGVGRLAAALGVTPNDLYRRVAIAESNHNT